MESDIWLDIIGFESFYQISNLGTVRSLNRTHQQLNWCGDYVSVTYKGRMIKLREAKNGYLYFTARVKDKVKTLKPHRLVAEHFIPNLGNKPEVNHLDGDKSNNKINNLAWVTSSENKIHAFDMGLMNNPTGYDGHAVKSKVQVLKNGNLVAELYGLEQIKDFGLTATGVWCTINNKQKTHRGYTFKRIRNEE